MGARRYAEGTTVSPEKSQADIQALLRKRGATEYAVGWKSQGAVLGFSLDGFRVRLELPFPQAEDVHIGPRQDPAEFLEREWKRRWRGLYLIIKSSGPGTTCGRRPPEISGGTPTTACKPSRRTPFTRSWRPTAGRRG